MKLGKFFERHEWSAEWSDNKIGNIEMEELDEFKDGLRNM